MKRHLTLLLLLVASFVTVDSAFAAESFDMFQTTADTTGTDKVWEYADGTNPYLYVQFYDTESLKKNERSNNTFLLTWEGHKSVTLHYPTDGSYVSGNSFYYLIDLNAAFGAGSKVGDWTISTTNPDSILKYDTAIGTRTVNFSGSDTFKVVATPEPLSCALFVIGGGALAFSRRRKKA